MSRGMLQCLTPVGLYRQCFGYSELGAMILRLQYRGPKANKRDHHWFRWVEAQELRFCPESPYDFPRHDLLSKSFHFP